jgi:hypothetical protein
MKKIKLHGKNAVGIYEFALVDNDIYPFLSRFTWYAKISGSSDMIYSVAYIWIGKDRKEVRMHRLIMNASPGVIIDHKNGLTVDNQESNLRPASQAENSRNTHKSTFKGCYYDARYKVWWCRIKSVGKALGLGTFDTELDCAIAYNHAALEQFGEFASFNRIPNWRNITPIPHTKIYNHHQSNNKSGVVGVGYHKSSGKWQATLTVEGKVIYLGTHPTLAEATIVRRNAEIKYLGKSDIVIPADV